MKGTAKGMYVDLEGMIEFAQDGIVSKTLEDKRQGSQPLLHVTRPDHFNSQIKFSGNNTRDTGTRKDSLRQQNL